VRGTRPWLAIVFSIQVFAFSQTLAQQSEPLTMIPADMAPGISPWSGLIVFPEGTDDVSVFISCQTSITITGTIGAPGCFSEHPDSFSYIRAIERAARSARADPAVVDNVRREVATVFSVLFLRQNGTETIALFQNDMSSRAEYGVGYVAPQIYYVPPSWCRCSTSQRHLQKFLVSETGEASIEAPPGLERCQACWNERAAEMRFIPGHVDGRNVEAAMSILVDP
jgi:hypothetical protein